MTKRVAVIGAGPSGLAQLRACQSAARKGAEVASDAVTGTVTTVKAAKGARRKTNA